MLLSKPSPDSHQLSLSHRGLLGLLYGLFSSPLLLIAKLVTCLMIYLHCHRITFTGSVVKVMPVSYVLDFEPLSKSSIRPIRVLLCDFCVQ